MYVSKYSTSQRVNFMEKVKKPSVSLHRRQFRYRPTDAALTSLAGQRITIHLICSTANVGQEEPQFVCHSHGLKQISPLALGDAPGAR